MTTPPNASAYQGAREDDWIIVGDEAFTPAEWEAIPHGTGVGYHYHACRCDECRAWRTAQSLKERKHDAR